LGTLKYDGTTTDFDDLVLAHLQIVIVQKIRRQEPFLMTWRESDPTGGGRTAIWIHQMAMMTFHFTTSAKTVIDPVWVKKLTDSANSAMGMFVTDADGEAVHPSNVDFAA
jgi:hypothetical protein